ncbi:hypothetical protein ACVWZ4_001306 [Bradyrhizobium sp. USDA 4472]
MRLIRFILLDLALTLLASENAQGMTIAPNPSVKSATEAQGSLINPRCRTVLGWRYRTQLSGANNIPIGIDNYLCGNPLGTLKPATLHVVEFLAAFFGLSAFALCYLVKLHDKYKGGGSS